MGITEYLQHLPSCNKRQNWTEAQEALSYCPEGSDKDAAYEELYYKMNQCTCGVNEAMVRFASSWYKKGWQDATESGTDEEIQGSFDRYIDIIKPI